MLDIKTLREYGANVDEAVKRCMNNEAFYLRMIKMAAADKNFERLSSALAAQDWKGAFEAAHALKGILGNLALDPMLKPATALTELLRPQQPLEPAQYAELLSEIEAQKAKFDEIIGQ